MTATLEPSDVSCSVEHALFHADWLIRYALDRIGGDGRAYHPGVRSHARGAQVQVLGAIECARPENDQVSV